MTTPPYAALAACLALLNIFQLTTGACDSSFYSSKFTGVIDALDLGNAAVGADINAQLAKKLKSQLTSGEGCGTTFEALVWEGTHGHDHQGANVLTPPNFCDGGMSGKAPGSNCGKVGGTYHFFRTGGGKSYSIFINPAGSDGDVDDSVNIQSVIDGCAGKANLLIDFTDCIEKTNRDANRFRGVIAIPSVGISTDRPNLWQATNGCSTSGFVWCKRGTWNGRDLTVFVVKPRKNKTYNGYRRLAA